MVRGALFSDLKAAAKVFKDMRKARKSGRETQIKNADQIFLVDSGPSLIHTVEGHVLMKGNKSIYYIAKKAFETLSYEERRKLAFAPVNGEFIERWHFWKNLLQPVMNPEQLRITMLSVLRWYIHIKRMDLTKGGAI